MVCTLWFMQHQGPHCCCDRVLRKVKETFGVPIITDIHESSQVRATAILLDTWSMQPVRGIELYLDDSAASAHGL